MLQISLSQEGAIWLNLFATVLFNVCSSVTVEGLYPCCVGVFGMFVVMKGRRNASP